ncbi:uncharacterized protein HD556DRAFT_1441848 [Suillus plorans]|uniref:Glycoside hydrolase family 31 N-terminal domain-containing protein n=1 Tax=Suillus plorans TaxID=116603 RepID=A0A9P7AT21_9AGAM|nr:uncharacterized protein HD556DRAFT_1441848 [Suillus plorans]KAG1796016.1 hypothetical protein HD556DRAFT_1441848 [Suillus plorans]
MDEEDGLRKRYNEATQWALTGEPLLSDGALWTIDGGKAKAVHGPKKDMKLVVDFNHRQNHAFPMWRRTGPWFESDTQDAFWDETFSTWTDTKPKGPFHLYNADIFGYPLDSPTSLYGSISLMDAHSATPTVAIFNAIASETWIELE